MLLLQNVDLIFRYGFLITVHGLEKEICRLVCDWEVEQAGKMGLDMAVLSKIGEGAETCTFRLRKK